MKLFLATLAASAALVCGSAAFAQSTGSAMPGSAMPGDAMHGDAMHGDAMHGDAMHGMKPIFACRPAADGEMPSAKMADGNGLVCKRLDPAMMMKGPGTPNSTPARAEDRAMMHMLFEYLYSGNG